MVPDGCTSVSAILLSRDGPAMGEEEANKTKLLAMFYLRSLKKGTYAHDPLRSRGFGVRSVAGVCRRQSGSLRDQNNYRLRGQDLQKKLYAIKMGHNEHFRVKSLPRQRAASSPTAHWKDNLS